ncbi:MAG: GNAT family N-acetyltransferase [Bacteroidetes bacterium]|nr:GNAT family N-acetyltransferase [Bacteroidota bacterium]
MKDLSISLANSSDEDLFRDLLPLFDQMYGEFKAMGIMLNPAADAAQRWTSSIRKTLGRFGTLALARKDDLLVGFAHAALSMPPDYLMAGKTGVITHVFVMPELRGEGIAGLLVTRLESWLREQNVRSVELQVLKGNSNGITFWEKSGYSAELIQYRKFFREE